MKHRVLEAIDALAAEQRLGDGSEVLTCFAGVVQKFPQLKALL